MTPVKNPVPMASGALLRVLLACALILTAGLLVKPHLERVFLRDSAETGAATLKIVVEGLDSTLDRFEPLAKLIAERPILAQLLRTPENEGILPFVNEQLRLTAMTLGVSDVYLMDVGGTTVAASNYRKETSFVGRNYSYRPYFQQAVDGGLGRYFARGTASGQRGYFFAAPVIDGTRIVGVLAIKFLVGPFETSWQGGASEIIVTDNAGVVFMSSRPEWHFRTLAPLAEAALDQIAATQQYPLDWLVPLENAVTEIDGLSLMTIGGADYLRTTTALPEVGWTVQLLTPAGPARAQALTVLLMLGLLALLMALATQIVLQRRARALERESERQAAQEELERQVIARTADLNEANERLLVEIDERRATEHRLRKTQKELVQAGKLAALGQMSAALSHEINQPLAAVKSYAENAAAYLDRERVTEARENVGRISQMADRMATLSGHLRNFARRPQETTGPVDLTRILDDTLDLMAPRLAKAGAEVRRTPAPNGPVWVTGGQVRLQQVFVNLINNALDAMDNQNGPVIEIEGPTQKGDRLVVCIRDHGPGLEAETATKLFDPFFTTKTPGKGLGLGLSISYNIVEDFGGRLSAKNHPDGGAVFAVDLAPSVGTKGVAAE